MPNGMLVQERLISDLRTEKVAKKKSDTSDLGASRYQPAGSLLDGQLWVAVARWSKIRQLSSKPAPRLAWAEKIGSKNWIVKLDREIGSDKAPNTMIQFSDPIF